jgi:hypothetical protein
LPVRTPNTSGVGVFVGSKVGVGESSTVGVGVLVRVGMLVITRTVGEGLFVGEATCCTGNHWYNPGRHTHSCQYQTGRNASDDNRFCVPKQGMQQPKIKRGLRGVSFSFVKGVNSVELILLTS